MPHVWVIEQIKASYFKQKKCTSRTWLDMVLHVYIEQFLQQIIISHGLGPTYLFQKDSSPPLEIEWCPLSKWEMGMWHFDKVQLQWSVFSLRSFEWVLITFCIYLQDWSLFVKHEDFTDSLLEMEKRSALKQRKAVLNKLCPWLWQFHWCGFAWLLYPWRTCVAGLRGWRAWSRVTTCTRTWWCWVRMRDSWPCVDICSMGCAR